MRAMLLASILLPATLLASTASAESVTRTYRLYHSLGTNDFVERGVVSVSSTDASAKKPTATVENAEDCLSPRDVDAMVEGGGMYRIRVVDEQDGRAVAMASVLGCDVRRANFREEITLILGNTGSLLSVSYNPLVSPLAPSCRSLTPLSSDDASPPSSELKFTTTVKYETDSAGMSVPLVLPQARPPPGLKFYPRKQGAGGGPGGAGGKTGIPGVEDEKPQHKSFLMRYWYIILPLAIMGLSGGAEEEPPQRGAGGGTGGGAGAAAAPAVAGAAAAGAGAGGGHRPRRGKRG